MTDEDLRKRLDDFQDLFVEARLCIEDCKDSMETTYYDEDAEAAKEAVNDAVKSYTAIITDLEEEEKNAASDEETKDEKKRPSRANDVRRGNGLKVEQLKGELELTLNGGH